MQFIYSYLWITLQSHIYYMNDYLYSIYIAYLAVFLASDPVSSLKVTGYKSAAKSPAIVFIHVPLTE